MPAFERPDTIFKAGGTLPADHPSYIERTADRELRAALLKGEFCYVLDSRQVGKSSLMVRTSEYLRQQGARVAQLDLTGIGSTASPEQWYASMLRRIGDNLGQRPALLRFWGDNVELGPLERLFEALETVAIPASESPLVIFVDEIDYVRNLKSFDTDEFFAKIREVYTRRATTPDLNRLTFCLLGSATPDALIRSVKATPFNIGKRFTLTDFTLGEARPFGAWLGKHGAAVMERVLYWTNGHPFLTQRVCESVHTEANLSGAKAVDAAVEQLFFGTNPREQSHLQQVAKRLLEDDDSGVDLPTRLDAYRKVHAQKRPRIREEVANPLHALLRLTGLVTLKERYLWIRNRVYFRAFDNAWIKDNSPDAEIRRIEDAERRVRRKAFLQWGGVTALTSALSIYSFMKTREANQKNDESEKALYAVNMNLIPRLWNRYDISRFNEAMSDSFKPSLIGIEWYYWNQQKNQYDLKLKDGDSQNNGYKYVTWSRDGNCIADDNSREVTIWNAVSGKMIRQSGSTRRNVSSPSFSPDSKNILTVRGSGAVVEDVFSGRSVLALDDSNNSVNAIDSASFSADGKRIVTRSINDNCVVWNVQSEGKVYSSPSFSTGFASFSPDGLELAIVNHDKIAVVLNVSSGTTIARLDQHLDDVNTAYFSPDGTRIVTSSKDKTAIVWDSQSGKRLVSLEWHADIVNSAVYSSDGTMIVTASSDRTAIVWNAFSGKPLIRTAGHSEDVSFADFSPDGKRFVTISKDGESKIWSSYLKKENLSVRVHKSGIKSSVFSAGGGKIITINNDNAVQTWDSWSGREIALTRDNSNTVKSADFSPDEKRIAIATDDGSVKILDLLSGQEAGLINDVSKTAKIVFFSRDGKRIITYGDNSPVIVWDSASGNRLLDLNRESRYIESVSFSPNGDYIAVQNSFLQGDGFVSILDARSGKVLKTVENKTDSLEFSPDNRSIAIVNFDNTVEIRNIASWEQISSRFCNAGEHVKFSPDGGRIVERAGRYAVVFDSYSGDELLKLNGHFDDIHSVDFAPDGKRVVTASKDKTIKIWDSYSGKELLTISDSEEVLSASFAPDGKRILTSGHDGILKIWGDLSQVDWQYMEDRAFHSSFGPSALEAATVEDWKGVIHCIGLRQSSAPEYLKEYTPKFLQARAEAYLRLGDYVHAIQDFSASYRFDKTDDIPYLKASIAVMQGNVPLYRQICESQINRLESKSNVKPSANSRDNFDNSIRVFGLMSGGVANYDEIIQSGYTLLKNRQISPRYLGMVLYRAGRYNEAIKLVMPDELLVGGVKRYHENWIGRALYHWIVLAACESKLENSVEATKWWRMVENEMTASLMSMDYVDIDFLIIWDELRRFFPERSLQERKQSKALAQKS